MRKMLTRFAGCFAATLVLAQSARAVPISGNISFTGDVNFNSSSVVNATTVTSWITPTVSSVSGTFAAPSPYAVALNTATLFTTSTWNLNTFTPINNFWSVDNFTFELLSSSIFQQSGSPGSGSIVVDGTCIVSGNGYTPTSMFWTFTSADVMTGYKPVGTFTVYSRSSPQVSVPDGGATATLLGVALAGMALVKRKVAA